MALFPRFSSRAKAKQGVPPDTLIPAALVSSALIQRVLGAQDRERRQLLVALVQVRGFMPLLMKRRNGGAWTAAERMALRDQLRAMAHLSPYLVVVALPGSFLVLPLLAWWLDRRRKVRGG